MKLRNLAGVLVVSSLMVGCGRGEDSNRVLLEGTALRRDLNLALNGDTAPQVALSDAPLGAQRAPDAAAPAAPAPSRQPAAAPARAPHAEPAREPAGPRYVTRTIPGGTAFTVRFDQTLSTQSYSVGESFSTTLAEALVDAQGRTVIPAGATVTGRVTRAHVANGTGRGADLGVTFTSIRYQGTSYPIDVTMVDAPAVRRDGRDPRIATVAKVSTGAA